MLVKITPLLRRFPIARITRAMYSDEKAGSIREAGGAFAKREAAYEDQYFRKLQQEQLKNLKTHYDDQIKHLEDEIKRNQDSIKELKKKAGSLEKK